MTAQVDPMRWSEAGSDAPETVRRLLEACRSDVGTDAELALLEARLGPIVAPPAPAPPAGAPPAGEGVAAGLGKGTLIKAALGLLVAAGAAVLFIALAPEGSPPTGAAPTTNAPSEVAPSEGTPLRPEPQPAATAPVAREPEPLTPSVSPSPAPRGAASVGPSEAELLGSAQAALAASPARAMSLLDEHRRRFPRGMLVQEREVLAIEALQRLGRRAEAAARGERFLKVFPGSAHRAKVQAITQGSANVR